MRDIYEAQALRVSCLGATRDVHGLGLGVSAFPGFWGPFKRVM